MELGRQLAQTCAKELVEAHGAESVCLIGSLTEKEGIHNRSDIDLVVRGLAPERYYRALADCYKHLEGRFELDVIPYEEANDRIRKHVRQEGILLAEQS